MSAALIAGVGLGLQVLGTVGSINAARKGNKALEEQNRQREKLAREQEKRQALQRRRERIRLVAEGRRRRASVVSGAVSQVGLSGISGSGVSGAVNTVSQRLGGALGTQTALASSGANLTRISSNIASAGSDLSQAQRQQGLFSAIGGFGGSMITNASSPAVRTIFSGIA